jgi:hypothetical protein
VLAGRKTGGLIEGDIRVQVRAWTPLAVTSSVAVARVFCSRPRVHSATYLASALQGHPKVQETFRRTMGYVEQNDIHSPNTTVGPSRCCGASPGNQG